MTTQTKGLKPFNRKVDVNEGSLVCERTERGQRIKGLRESSGLTTAEFAQKCGVTEVTQYNYERGTRVPDADYLAALYFEFAVDLGPLVTGAPRPKSVKVTADVEEMLGRYAALPPKLRKTVDDVLLLAWLAYQNRRAVHDEVDGPAAPAKRVATKKT